MAHSLPNRGAAPLTPRPPNSLGAVSNKPSPRASKYLRPQESGPVLHVTILGASFKEKGQYFLTLNSCGSSRHTEVSDNRVYQPSKEEHFSFTLGESDLDLELKISATRVRLALPQLSPRGIMANHDNNNSLSEDAVYGWDDEIGSTTLTVGQLLSTPQPAGDATKYHEVELYANQRPGVRGQLVGVVRLVWSMEDRIAEAHEAAARAVDLYQQSRAEKPPDGSSEPAAVFFPTAAAARRARDHVCKKAAEEAAAKAEAEAAAFDRAMLEARWRDVLNLYRVVLWLPEGSVPGSVELSAKQAAGLADVANKHPSGRVAFIHTGSKITLSREVVRMIRSRLEEKLELPPRRMRENAGEGPILIFANGPRMAGGAGVNQRASTVPAGEQAEKQKQQQAASQQDGEEDDGAGVLPQQQEPAKPVTAAPSTRPRPPVHHESCTWLEAATLPFRPTSPRIGPNVKTAALLRANEGGARPTAARHGGFNGILPEPPAKIMPTAPTRVAPPVDVE